jgi:putative ABC transport system permease protein
MKILNKFTVKNLKLNKKRTIVTIIGIILSTALICGVAGLVSSFQKTLVEATIATDGNFHAKFNNVSKDKFSYATENQKVKQYFFTSELGWAVLDGGQNSDKPYVQVMEYDKTALENFGINLIDGRLPENSNEILISEHIRTNAQVNWKVGDKITINVGERISEDGSKLNEYNPYGMIEKYDAELEEYEYAKSEEKIVNAESRTYTIVGITKRLNYENYSSPGYKAITYKENLRETEDISVLYKHAKDYKEINKEMSKNLETEDIGLNMDLIRFQGGLGDSTMAAVISVAGVVIVIIIIASVFVIRNSFSISVSERNRQYGMLASIGATSKQIKRNVVFEGMVVGLIAIPLGILLGIVAIIILLEVVNYILGDLLMGMEFVYTINIPGIIISVVISLITIYLSTLIPAKRAAKISPIESIRGNKDTKIKSKKVRTSKFTKKIFGIGGVIASKNLKRSKKKYRTTVISIVVSIFIFISLSSFLSYGMDMTGYYYTEYSYNLYVNHGNSDSISAKEQENIYNEIIKLDGIDKYSYTWETSVPSDMYKYSNGRFIETDGCRILIYNNEYFKEYMKELGLKEEDYKTAVILIDDELNYNADGSKNLAKLYSLKKGDTVNLKIGDNITSIKISENPTKRPMGLESVYAYGGEILVSQEFARENFDRNFKDLFDIGNLLIHSENADKMEEGIDRLKNEKGYLNIEVNNLDTFVKQQKKIVVVAAIFLYGFITVITLIGVTNIFNTITTNMILRSKEFATLKSIGMTTKEFNKMIRLESIMYGTKALIIGIPLGILGSYLIYYGFAKEMDLGYNIPLTPILISAVFVFIIIGITMKYSLNKINKQNIIETIRKDNI